MKLTLAEVEHAANGTWVGATVDTTLSVEGWSIDSRSISPGDLFFALKGDRYDGHTFLAAAFDSGALAAVVSEPVAIDKKPLLAVADTLKALQSVAAWSRTHWAKPVVAITGSAGKTTTKEIMAALLSTRLSVGKTIGNLNNHIGLPLTLLRVPQAADLAVVELGMNHAGEIRELARIVRPQVGVVTNVGFAHVEAFESIDDIAAAKRELIENLPAEGIAVLNADDPRVLAFRGSHRGRTVTYGLHPAADIRASDVELGPEGSSFSVAGVLFKTSLAGSHGVSNILAGITVASLFDIQPADLVDAVARLSPGKMRGVRHTLRGVTVLDDSYNSNPEAARAMLDVLLREPARRRIAVLGEMLELGRLAETLHRELGRYAAKRGIDVLIGIQGASRHMLAAARDAGMAPASSFFFDEAESAGEFLREFVQPGDAILFKGSRGTRVERALAKMEE
jgi:UDP-N-acetylmuramoyl-tripeptide--D-alanyl-D-alanine ligase